MFQMSDGTDFSWDNFEQAKNPFLNRDLVYMKHLFPMEHKYNGRTAALTEALAGDPVNYPQGADRAQGGSTYWFGYGLACRKMGFEYGMENRPIQWPFLCA